MKPFTPRFIEITNENMKEYYGIDLTTDKVNRQALNAEKDADVLRRFITRS